MKTILFFATLLFLSISTRNASAANPTEDSCVAFMLVQTDHNDPMTIHFAFNGVVPVGSFQFQGLWDFGDGDFSTDSLPVHTYAQPGTYLVCLSFSICIGGGISCHDDTCQYVTVGAIAGIGENQDILTNFLYYPNPVRSQCHIRTNSGFEFQLTLRDLQGRFILQKTKRNDEPIDFSGLASGVYSIEVSDAHSILKKLIVVQQ